MDKVNNGIGIGIVLVVFIFILDNSKYEILFEVNYIEFYISNIYLDVVVEKINNKVCLGFNYIKELLGKEFIDNMIYDESFIIDKFIYDKLLWN